MQKIEKLTATKATANNTTVVTFQIKLDNGLMIQSGIPIESVDAARDADKAVQIVNDIIAQIVEGLNPLRQRELDKMICELSELHNLHSLTSAISFGLSLTIVKAAAALNNESLTTHMRRVYGYDKKDPMRRPVVVLVVRQSDGAQGEFREFSLIPARDRDVSEAMTMFRKVQDRLGSMVHTLMNTVQLEIMQEKIREASYMLHHDLYVGIKPALKNDTQNGYLCNDMLDFASTQQMIEYYQELQALYAPLINEMPLNPDEINAYAALQQHIGDQTIISVGLNTIETAQQYKRYSSVIPGAMLSMKYDSLKSVSQFVELVSESAECNWKTMIDCVGCIDHAALFALGVAASVDFIKIDSCSSDIEKELQYAGQAN